MDNGERAQVLEQLSQALFGDGGYEVVAKLTSEQSELERKSGLAINTASAVAGPAAIWQATRSAKENKGGIPRDITRIASRKAPKGSAVRGAAKNVVEALDTKRGKWGAAGATAAAGGLVTLQAANWAGDVIATRALRKKDPVKKSSPDQADLNTGNASAPAKRKVYLNRGTLTAMVAEKGAAATKEGAVKATPVLVDQGRRIKTNAESKIKKDDGHDVVWEGEFAKFDTDKRQVFGWASIVEVDGKPVVDLQGDYITPDEIEKAAYTYVQKSRKGGDMHRRDGDQPYHASEMIESFMVTPEKKQAMGLPDSVPTGWWVGFAVHDDATWDLVKKGQRTGFSIHGRGRRVTADD